MKTLTRAAVTAALALTLVSPRIAAAAGPELAYRLTEGQNLNAFIRDGVVAFPAGNSGTGLWFERLDRSAEWRLDAAPKPVREGVSRGIVFSAEITTPRLVPRQAVLSNVRYLRDYQSVGRFPPEVAVKPSIAGDTITYRRPRLDGAPGYGLTLRVIEGRIDQGAIIAGVKGKIRLEVTALTGDAPLTPLPVPQLLNARAAKDPAARNALAFLSYREKFLAGSWRFNTYFGRDTLMSTRLLMPALRPEATEAGLNSVLARLSAEGEVAHELDYGMIDGDYMLGPVAADYLLGPGRARAAGYLATTLASESRPGEREPVGALLVRNLRFVLAAAAPFAEAPGKAKLIALKAGRMTGEWRDSNEGLGRGIYAYDVNATLVPAALEAADRLLKAGLLDPYLSDQERLRFKRAGEAARVWRAKAPPLFDVKLDNDQARRAIDAYAASMGVPATPALTALGGYSLTFHALSLDAEGRPVPIVNSDEGFLLLFGAPSARDLDTYLGAIMRPFPAGLMTDVGLVVANPAFAGDEVKTRFSPAEYHGAVVWSWQQALLAAGIERQLARRDLPQATKARLKAAQASLWRAIDATRALQSSELWSWTFRDGRYQVVPFGAGKADVDESNAAQLWSTVYLAVRPPAGK